MKEGHREALKEAEAKIFESARKLKAMGLTNTQISKSLGLSPSAIKKL